MRELCLTDEIIQQFVDGELSNEQTEAAASHLSQCEACSQLLGEVEQENALLMKAFAPEMNLPVPTTSLRQRLDAAIADLEPQPRALLSETEGFSLRHWLASVFGSLSFTPQQSLGFASLIVIVAFATIFAVIQLRQKEQAQPTVAEQRGAQPVIEQSPAPVVKGGDESAAGPSTASTPVLQKTNYNSTQRRRIVKRTGAKAESAQPPDSMRSAPAGPKLLPGEQGYLEAIASLTTAIEANKDDVLRPSVRADYERNLAVVDQAIASTRQQAKRNPDDRIAAEFMYTAYQNKIELLSAVADQTRMASR